jgi:hypothetical protein
MERIKSQSRDCKTVGWESRPLEPDRPRLRHRDEKLVESWVPRATSCKGHCGGTSSKSASICSAHPCRMTATETPAPDMICMCHRATQTATVVRLPPPHPRCNVEEFAFSLSQTLLTFYPLLDPDHLVFSKLFIASYRACYHAPLWLVNQIVCQEREINIK